MPTMTTRQAAERLGVKVETLYAYVSRGLLESNPADDGRSSVFDRRAVEELARRGRPRLSSRVTSIDLLIETRLTALSSRGVRYRGHDTADLASTTSFEDVATLLWLGPGRHSTRPWKGTVIAGLDGLRPSAAIPVITALVAAGCSADDGAAGDGPAGDGSAGDGSAGDGSAVDLDPETIASAGHYLIATIVDSLPLMANATSAPLLRLANSDKPIRSSIAGRLWYRLTSQRPNPDLVCALNAALVLLADHELATSTLAARVAASTRAGPHAVVSAGLATLSGPLHGGASRLARSMLSDNERLGARAAIDNALRSHRVLPGFGHKVYADIDPRAEVLLDLLRRSPVGGRSMAPVDRLIGGYRERSEHRPNIDLALAALGHLTGMSVDAGEVIIAIARTSGWLAHAIEEYAEPALRFRPRASYVGAAPVSPYSVSRP